MAVSRLEIRSRTPLAGGIAFGDAGAYERVDGIVRFGVDPGLAANRRIVDLDLAERHAGGLVEFESDFCLLQPVDPARGNGRLLFDVLNRGRKVAVRIFNRCPYAAAQTAEIDPGDGFLMRRGWTILWAGWQWDVIRDGTLMGLEAPQAVDASGQPIQGHLVCEFQPVDRDRDRLLADRVHRPYPAADVEDQSAQLAVRDWPDGPRTVIPRDHWRFAHDEAGKPVPDDQRIWLDGGFEPGKVYQVVYRTRICPVVGTGLLAVRDTVAFLRYGGAAEGNPAAGRVERTYAFGMSQSGRFLRHFLSLGLNADESGRQVFDGLHVHVAGARRGEFNQRFGQPSVQHTRNFGHLPPFLTRDLLPDTAVPRIVETNTSAEYWRGDCSLLHITADGARDEEVPDDLRLYHFAGTQHTPGTLPLGTVGPDGARAANPSNAVDYSPLMRAALLNLDRWVSEGSPPPPSRHPRLSDATAVPPAAALAIYRAIPGIAVPADGRVPTMARVDLGPDAERGVGRYPLPPGEPYRTSVSAVDSDGNETAGVRLPDLTVPLASYAGWNPRAADTGGHGQIVSMLGSTFPFVATEEERSAQGDPRPSVQARYKNEDEYVDRVRSAAESLAGEGYLLSDDIETEADLARARYRAWARGRS